LPISARKNTDDLGIDVSTPASACSPFRARPPSERLRLRSATNQPPTTHGEPRQPPNPSLLAGDVLRACPREEEGRCTVRSRSDSDLPLRSTRPRAGHQIWAGPGLIWPASLEDRPVTFFQTIFTISDSLLDSKIHRIFSVCRNLVIQISMCSLLLYLSNGIGPMIVDRP
jgi:hypothetical protein